jgi:hypothetical protein
LAKVSGLGWTTLSLDDGSGSPIDIKNDITDLDMATPRAVQDVTGVDKSAFERILLLADFSATLNGVFDPAASKAHVVLSTASSSNQVRSFASTIQAKTLNVETLLTDYPLKRAASGEFTFSAPLVLADGNVPTWA